MENFTEDELRKVSKKQARRRRILWTSIIVLSVLLAYLLYLRFSVN